MKHKRLLTAALAASLAVSSLPAALALDTAPPMYQQFGYDSVEAYTSSYDWWFDKFSYDQASDCYRRHLDEIATRPSRSASMTPSRATSRNGSTAVTGMTARPSTAARRST